MKKESNLTYKDETDIVDSIKQIKHEVHQNNLMLSDICKVINYWLANSNNENENDFGRNVLANLLSNMVELRGLKK